MTDRKNFISFILSMSLCIIAGVIASFPISDSYIWHETIQKSSLMPKLWLFSPLWGFTYAVMGVAFWVIIKNKSRNPNYWFAFNLFVIQLVINVLWTYLFFGSLMVKYAYIVILILDALVLMTVAIFGKISHMAQWIMLPYVVWLGFVTYFNWHIL